LVLFGTCTCFHVKFIPHLLAQHHCLLPIGYDISSYMVNSWPSRIRWAHFVVAYQLQKVLCVSNQILACIYHRGMITFSLLVGHAQKGTLGPPPLALQKCSSESIQFLGYQIGDQIPTWNALMLTIDGQITLVKGVMVFHPFCVLMVDHKPL
jgi:hypothetical protein